MKILYSNEINNITASASGLGADYGVEVVQDIYPQHEYIADAASTTITVSVNAGAEALFLSNWFADTANVVMKDSGGTTLGNVVLDCSFDDSLDWEGMHALMNPIWVDLPTGTVSVEIQLTTSVDRKHDIDDFAATGVNNTGHFRSSSAAAIPYHDHVQLRIGSRVNGNAAILALSGDGTTPGNVQLSNAVTSFQVTELLMPIYVGILRVGKVAHFRNPGTGLQLGGKDHSLKLETPGGGFTSVKHGVSRTANGQVFMDLEEKVLFEKITRSLRSEPFPVHLLYNQGVLDESTTFFARFTDLPSVVADSASYSNVKASLSFIEVI